jgi:hypothetical protein
MAKSREKLIEEIMKDLKDDNITYEDACAIADQEIHNKQCAKRNYVVSENRPKTPKKPKKEDKEKLALIHFLKFCLTRTSKSKNIDFEVLNVEIAKEGEITFNVGDDEFSLKIIRHRNKK